MPNVHVKFRGPHLLNGNKLLNPGSVVVLDEDTAKEVVRRGMGELHPGPASEAPGHPSGCGYKADGTPLANRPFGFAGEPEHADLGSRIASAEKAVARPQAAGTR